MSSGITESRSFSQFGADIVIGGTREQIVHVSIPESIP